MTEKSFFGRGIICLFILSFSSLNFYTQSNPGDLMFVGFNADGIEGFSLAAMRELPSNSDYYITDNEWNGLAFDEGGQFNDFSEGIVHWNTGPIPIPAGTVIDFIGTSSDLDLSYGADYGTITGELRIDNANEVLYCYQGLDGTFPTNFITAITNRIFATFSGSIEGTGLLANVNAVQINQNADVMVYEGDTECSVSVEACINQISSPLNWATQSGLNDQDEDGVYPDFLIDVPLFFFGAFLPIALEAFDLKNINDREILLSWSTLTETNNDYFSIERSIDGNDWVVLEQISGAVNSINRLTYSYVDKEPFVGTSYYRLKQTDIDGAFTHSEIINAKIEATIKLSLFPNPTSEIMTISGQNLHLKSVIFYDSLGHEVKLEEDGRTEMKRTFITKSLVDGIYFISVGEGEENITTSFLKH